jgi:hypothetical protein
MCSEAHPASYAVGTGPNSPRLKELGCEADHSRPSSAKVKKSWLHNNDSP